MRGTSQEKLYQELGLESLRSRRWLRRMSYFYKLIKTQKPLYLFNLIPPKFNSLCHPNTNSVMRCRNDYLKKFFIPYVVRKWNRLSTEIRNSTSCQEFRKSLLSFIKPTCFSLFSIHHHVQSCRNWLKFWLTSKKIREIHNIVFLVQNVMRNSMVHLVKFSRLGKKSYERKCRRSVLRKIQYCTGSLQMLEYYN